jgi:FKBP-type peptidyl-prolyl cis-trans isomerase SlyD
VRIFAGFFIEKENTLMKITGNMYVAIDYCLTLESGEEINRSPAGNPWAFIAGTGQIIPGLENKLKGMAAGDDAKITVEPEDAYGQIREDLFQVIPRDQIPADMKIEPGMTFQAQRPHGLVTFSVKSVDDDTVTIDLNHPLSGKRLHFDVKVVEVREASAEELAAVSGSCGCGSSSPTQCGSGCSCGQ